MVVFAPGGRRFRNLEQPAVVIAVGLAAWLLAGNVDQPTWPVLAAHMVAFFLVCVGLHGMLVDGRPPADQLSTMYLAMSAGGACGGLFNALLAPAVFDAHHEFPLAIALASALLAEANAGRWSSSRWLIVAGPAAVVAVLAVVAPWLAAPRWAWLAALAALLAAALVVLRRLERGLVVVDDARLALEREPAGGIDLLVVDAFTGDSVPTHLLTREALALYGRVLASGGGIALHVSNKYLDLVPVVERLAADGGWMALQGRDDDVPADFARTPSEWMVLSRSLELIKAIYAAPTSSRWRWQPCAERPSGRPWTDDHTAVAEALRR